MVSRKGSLVLGVAMMAFGLAAGCGKDSQTVQSGSTPTTDASAVAPVVLSYGDHSTTVDVAGLPTQDYKGSAVVSLAAVWAKGQLADDASKLTFDFEGDDGFHPSSRDKCKKNVSGADLAKGYIVPATRTLVWDDALGLPGCYNVHNVAKMIGLGG